MVSLPVVWTDDVVVSGDAVVLGGLVVSEGDVVVCFNVVVGGDVAKMNLKKSSVSWVLVRLTTRNGFETVRFS